MNATRERIGKTVRDKAKGHVPGFKNRKPEGERGHLHGQKKAAWVKSMSRRNRSRAA